MNSNSVNDSADLILQNLLKLFGNDVVLVWSNNGQKGPRCRGWQNTGIQIM